MCIFLLMFSTVTIFIIILFRKTSIRYGTKHEYENIQMDVSSTQIDKTFYMIASNSIYKSVSTWLRRTS